MRSAPLTSPSFSVNACCATSGAGPRPAIGSSRAKKPDSCTVSPCSLGDACRGRAGVLISLRQLVGDCVGACGLRALARQLVLDLRRGPRRACASCRLLVDHLDDVVAELRLHEIADLCRAAARTRRPRTPAPCGRGRSNRGRRPSASLPSSSEYFFASSAKSAPRLHLLRAGPRPASSRPRRPCPRS